MPADHDRKAEISAMFDDFVRDALETLVVATIALVWVWTCFVALFDAVHAAYGYLALAAAAAAALATYHLARRNLRAAVALYLASLIVIISILVSDLSQCRESLPLFAGHPGGGSVD